MASLTWRICAQALGFRSLETLEIDVCENIGNAREFCGMVTADARVCRHLEAFITDVIDSRPDVAHDVAERFVAKRHGDGHDLHFARDNIQETLRRAVRTAARRWGEEDGRRIVADIVDSCREKARSSV